MASTSQPNTPKPAPWKSTFHDHLQKMDSPEFVFSTLHPVSQDPSQTQHSVTSFVPRARYCIFRGFWAELPENKRNPATMNPRVYESDLPTLTTDIRMHKVGELFASSAGRADDESLTQGSGGGGPCEAVWWVKDVMTQWRMRGEAFIVAPDIEGQGEQSRESSGVRTVKSEVGARMRVVKEEGREEWSWVRELTGHFGNVSPGMRGTFAAPPPGQPVDQPYDDKKLKLGEKIEDLEDPVARQHFRVVIIRPQEVESVDLSDPKTSRRQLYTYNDDTGDWTHQECWP